MLPPRRQEHGLAKMLRGRTTPASGATPARKGDVQTGKNAGYFMAEAKTTSKDSMTLKREWLEKVLCDTVGDGRTPIIEIEFQATPTRPVHRFYLVDAADVDEFLVVLRKDAR